MPSIRFSKRHRKRRNPEPETAINGVYAILGPNGVYIGESQDIEHRETYKLAAQLGLDRGIVREFPIRTSRTGRLKAERDVANLFRSRGLPVVTNSFVKEGYDG